jgi:uncharacterized membrane protein
MSEWIEHTVQIEVETPVATAWDLWSDLELMPNWMKWIESVRILPHDPQLSQWRLATNGFEFKWLSKIVKLVDRQLIQWEAVDGLPNRGAIRFYDRGDCSIVKLTVAYAIPGWLAMLMDNGFIRNAVEGSLQKDLERFRQYALQTTGTR